MLTTINYLECKDIRYIHFIGIGGISMSGLAEILLDQGYMVSGSDLKESPITAKLAAMGVKIFYGHSEDNISNPDLVVYTAAVRDDNPELVAARKRNIPAVERAVLLGQIMKKYPFPVAVSGTHGKTTTTSLISMVMIEAGLNPTVHIGGEFAAIGGTTRIGGSEFFVAEACEYHESFLKFYPYLGVVLNIEFDHADYFENIGRIREAFSKFVQRIPENGYLVACIDDPNVRLVLGSAKCTIITYGKDSPDAVWSARDIKLDEGGCASFTLLKDKEPAASISLRIPGVHNINNALAAIASCHTLGCSMDSIKKGIRSFTGAHRRFELKGVVNRIRVVDDYAHHPSEVKATLEAARNASGSRIWCVFQPHTYTRTKSLLDDFAVSFENADTVILTDIYAAREKDKGEIHSLDLAEKMKSAGKNVLYIPDFNSIVKYLSDNASPGDLIITMGAGDVYKVGEMFLKKGRVIAV